jgi:hypothetical protein
MYTDSAVCSAGPVDLHAVDFTNACVLPPHATGVKRGYASESVEDFAV